MTPFLQSGVSRVRTLRRGKEGSTKDETKVEWGRRGDTSPSWVETYQRIRTKSRTKESQICIDFWFMDGPECIEEIFILVYSISVPIVIKGFPTLAEKFLNVDPVSSSKFIGRDKPYPPIP